MICAEREREREFFLEDHRHHSARARCCTIESVLHVNYSGAINQAGFNALDAQIHKRRMSACVAYEHMDKALTLAGPVIVNKWIWPFETPPSAVIVRQDQFDQAIAFSNALAYRGITRFVFLQSERRMAQAFVERVRERRSR